MSHQFGITKFKDLVYKPMHCFASSGYMIASRDFDGCVRLYVWGRKENGEMESVEILLHEGEVVELGEAVADDLRKESAKIPEPRRVGGLRERVRGTAALIQENNNDR